MNDREDGYDGGLDDEDVTGMAPDERYRDEQQDAEEDEHDTQ